MALIESAPNAVHIGGDDVVGNNVLHHPEPEVRDLRQHRSLAGNRLGHHHIERRKPVGGLGRITGVNRLPTQAKTTGHCRQNGGVMAGHPDLHAGPAVRLSICDNGNGMDKATLERIFERFFTTKSVGKGSGLGLSVVHGIVKSHQGAVTVESEPGKGTVFHIYLPPQAGEERETPTEFKIVPSENHERILFVDDDELAGRATEKVLSRFGYQVRWFRRPEEALEHFRACPAEFDLVVSDLAMPGMSGDNLAAALLHIRPDIPILITTGMIDTPILKKAGEIGVCKVLLKPVSATTLAHEIAQRLADRSPIKPRGKVKTHPGPPDAPAH